VRSDRRIIARMSLIVRNLVKQGFWQYANRHNTLFVMIYRKLLAITLGESDMWKDSLKNAYLA
jgi:hypothetical protein